MDPSRYETPGPTTGCHRMKINRQEKQRKEEENTSRSLGMEENGRREAYGEIKRRTEDQDG